MECLPSWVSENCVDEFDIHEFVNCFEDPIICFPAFNFHHDLRVLRNLEQMQRKLNYCTFTIFLGFDSSSSAILGVCLLLYIILI